MTGRPDNGLIMIPSVRRGAVLLFLAGALGGQLHAREAGLTARTMSLWEAIAVLAPQGAFERARVEGALGTTLSTALKGANNYFDLYQSRPVALADGVVVSNVDLRIARDGSHPGFMVLEIAGSCITLAQVRSRYGPLRITGVPRGRSMHETTSHTSDRPWGTLTFSYAERHPDCLASVAFDPVERRRP